MLFVLSCPIPISEDVLLNIKDTFGSVKVITSPQNGSFCAKTMLVTGTDTDVSTEEGAAGEVRSLRYEILATDKTGEASFNEEGAFTFDFAATDLGSTFVLKITAETRR